MIKNFILKFKKLLIILGLIGIASAAVILQPAKQPEPFGIVEESLFAEIDNQNKVLRVIVADQEFIDSGKVGNSKNWIKTSYSGTIRKNYPDKGYKYDKTLDAFIPPKSSDTAILNTNTAKWEEPIKTKPFIDYSIPTTTPL